MERHPLDAIFRPRSVAVIGASRRRGTFGAEVLHNLLASGFAGPVYPINPNARAVQSVRAFDTVGDVPDDLDLAVVAVPQHRVLGVVDECRAKGVRGLVVLSAGFAETGPEGRALQDELRRRVRAAGIRMVGPNCLGVLNADPSVGLNATFTPTWPPSGPVAIASQSGAVGLALLDYARDLGIGISQFAGMSNKADLSGNDLLEYWENDPNTRVILLYLESFGNPARFMQIAKRVSRTKPILVVKSGRTEAGARGLVPHGSARRHGRRGGRAPRSGRGSCAPIPSRSSSIWRCSWPTSPCPPVDASRLSRTPGDRASWPPMRARATGSK